MDLPKAGQSITVIKPGKFCGYYGNVVAVVDDSVIVSFGSIGSNAFKISEVKVFQDISIRPGKQYEEW